MKRMITTALCLVLLLAALPLAVSAEGECDINGHDFAEATCTDAKKCTICGVEKMNLHYWDDGVVTVEPTDQTAGEKLYKCNVCGATKTETVTPEDMEARPQSQPQPQPESDYATNIIIAGVFLFLSVIALLAALMKKRRQEVKD